MNRTIKKYFYCLCMYLYSICTIHMCALVIVVFIPLFLNTVRPKFKVRNMKSFVVEKSGNTVRLNINFEVF